ncbi:hypothetical protein [Azospirillum brasilense]|uniref:hypothetical protein n=1 Tax=Azospirillum brasilense TaxID=192 RepID=UPI00119D4A20|nr:hypothetical protein [Azospirillum brasilense]
MNQGYKEKVSLKEVAAKWGLRLMLVINFFMFFGLSYQYGIREIVRPTEGWNWTDFITILLAILTIVLAALGTLIAVAALWGIQTLQNGASEISRKTVEEYLKSAQLDGRLKALVQEHYQNYIDSMEAKRRLATTEGEEPLSPEDAALAGAHEDTDWRDL